MLCWTDTHDVLQIVEPASGAEDASNEKPGKTKKQKQKGAYSPQRLHTAVCKFAPHFKACICMHARVHPGKTRPIRAYLRIPLPPRRRCHLEFAAATALSASAHQLLLL